VASRRPAFGARPPVCRSTVLDDLLSGGEHADEHGTRGGRAFDRAGAGYGVLDPTRLDPLDPVPARHACAPGCAAAFLGPGADAMHRPPEVELFPVWLGDYEQERPGRTHVRKGGRERRGRGGAVAHDQPTVGFRGSGARRAECCACRDGCDRWQQPLSI